MFSFALSQLKSYRGGGQFCSCKCKVLHYRENPGSHPLSVGWRIDNAGYRGKFSWVDGKKVYLREHRVIAEKFLGRKLGRREIVHHRNGVKTDNRPENLEVTTPREHGKTHANENREFYVRMLDRGRKAYLTNHREWKKTHWSKEYLSCVRCGTKERKHQGRGLCTKCYLEKYRMGTLKEMENEDDGIVFGKKF